MEDNRFLIFAKYETKGKGAQNVGDGGPDDVANREWGAVASYGHHDNSELFEGSDLRSQEEVCDTDLFPFRTSC